MNGFDENFSQFFAISQLQPSRKSNCVILRLRPTPRKMNCVSCEIVIFSQSEFAIFAILQPYSRIILSSICILWTWTQREKLFIWCSFNTACTCEKSRIWKRATIVDRSRNSLEVSFCSSSNIYGSEMLFVEYPTLIYHLKCW